MNTSKFDKLVGRLALFLLHQGNLNTPVSAGQRVADTILYIDFLCG